MVKICSVITANNNSRVSIGPQKHEQQFGRRKDQETRVSPLFQILPNAIYSVETKGKVLPIFFTSKISFTVKGFYSSLQGKYQSRQKPRGSRLIVLAQHSDRSAFLEDALLARHAISPPKRTLSRKDCVTSQKSVFEGG